MKIKEFKSFRIFNLIKQRIGMNNSNLTILDRCDIPELQRILSALNDNSRPVIILVNVTNNNQSIGDVINSTAIGCNTNEQL